eukprot:CAMPEP_0196656222 /NCGR_PEP_ID=MMETSP1086-20130531/14093_1 /TAXON_ID=77921 /ORGANISM="Cyanoptyche  gloeocystis , Strain SAG4.97" /LENGTH=208 /DNA_ID=CAMNT_0041988873 /DNA_START=205 /DNA_END=831 /DNA_ORIENTATION=+
MSFASAAAEPSTSLFQIVSEQSSSNTSRNGIVAIFAAMIAVVAAGTFSSSGGRVTLDTLASQSVPIDIALSNGKPTVVEFYADWCEGCKSMVPDVAALETDFEGNLNFVMLNVDNSRWIPELDKYDVDGIPHFEFLDERGNDVGRAIGKQPRSVLQANMAALARHDVPLPYADAVGETSSIDPGSSLSTERVSDPLAHSSVPVRQRPQ